MTIRTPSAEGRQAGPDVYQKAQRHLARRDPVLKRLIRKVGPCTLRPGPDHFKELVRSIIAQQISTLAARSIAARLAQVVGGVGVTPAAILALPEAKLRGAGLSASKARSLRDLASRVHTGGLPLHELPALEDKEVIARLVGVWGIGPWTGQMFLIFSLGRLDVLPVADFGLRAGVQRQYELAALPDRERLEELAEPWRPYRSIATWYFWRTSD
jgi:DNA-3-methyladenine glycosylase II